ncbi:hypothetical protein ATANTOWER_009573 [Ataeniobius toweri]|uniref:Uncharacterized protein n=1 Tax=Ataeniobius toweri TaxID=208326 RepID=A0ABU7BTS7_9TELE|nr:hypothetical protein [Ataeniobius toweri]
MKAVAAVKLLVLRLPLSAAVGEEAEPRAQQRRYRVSKIKKNYRNIQRGGSPSEHVPYSCWETIRLNWKERVLSTGIRRQSSGGTPLLHLTGRVTVCESGLPYHGQPALHGRKMADLEAVLADVSYLMAMEKSKSTPAARASKKIILPEPRVSAPHGSTPRLFPLTH